MDRISEIVSVINEGVSGVFLECEVFGIAERVIYSEKTAYFEKKANEVQCRVDIDDSKRATVLHIIRSATEEIDNQQGFGSKPLQTETYNMSLVVFSSNVDNATTGKKLADLVKYSIPLTVDRGKRDEISARRVSINITGANLDRNAVWSELFDGQKNNLADNYILFSIEYSVVIVIDNTCVLQTCEKV